MKLSMQFANIILIATGLTLLSCSKNFLSKQPQGSLTEESLSNAAGVNSLLVGAYSALSGQDDGSNLNGGSAWAVSPDNWIYGSVVGGDAHKGSDAGDQPSISVLATFTTDPSISFLNDNWVCRYEGITRCNNVLKLVDKAADLSSDDALNIKAQARFLRAHYYFELKKMFDMVPWISDSTEDLNQPNNIDIWPYIESDFQYAYENLPGTQDEIGRANKWAAAAYLGKTYLYEEKYTAAKAMFDVVISEGTTTGGITYDLNTEFENNFRPEKESSNPEAIFDVEMAANSGNSSIAQANQGDMLNFPYGSSPFGCCGFFQPAQDLVNSYRTDASGLPYLDDYNTYAVKNDMNITSAQSFTPDEGNLDPRLDWTVGRRGIPYLDWGLHPGADWIRSQSYGGPYAPKKNVYWQSSASSYYDGSSWAPGSAINVHIIRFADVLLMAAEAEAVLGNLSQAETFVNRVRTRASNTVGYVYTYLDDSDPTGGFSTTPAANYVISTYPTGTFTSKGQAYALKAIYFERKLELGMEGHRFFDLVRWGVAKSVMDAFFNYEGRITTDVSGATFTDPKNNYYPIPQTQIDLTTVNGTKTLTQNKGY